MSYYKLINHCVFYFDQNTFVLDDYLNHVKKGINEEFIPFLVFLKKWRTKNEIENFIIDKELPDQIFESLLYEDLISIDNEYIDKKFESWGKSTEFFYFATRQHANNSFENIIDSTNKLAITNETKPDIYLSYKEKEIIKLPLPTLETKIKNQTLIDNLLKRETIRSFKNEVPVSKDDFSNIIYLTHGEVASTIDYDGSKIMFKTSPSGGARNSIETFIVINNVEGIKQGLYHYNVENHALELLKSGDFRKKTITLFGNQEFIGDTAFLSIYASKLDRIYWKYRTFKGLKVLYGDVGHISQSFYLLANHFNYGAFFTGAMREELVEKFLDLNKYDFMILGCNGLGVPLDNNNYIGRNIRKDYESQERRGKNDSGI